ncbi:hypothetical protein BpHYR1_006648 [Brachionus plicatilis]|uniref:Uncharacterized protein n=1 Tax=Brachionus plicatilis TaxID=10195 RepID=A0A3M7R1T1_BRAPC|nr:hypothetical protein BpHYR1_006648 [Brachionus plicatilis]
MVTTIQSNDLAMNSNQAANRSTTLKAQTQIHNLFIFSNTRIRTRTFSRNKLLFTFKKPLEI